MTRGTANMPATRQTTVHHRFHVARIYDTYTNRGDFVDGFQTFEDAALAAAQELARPGVKLVTVFDSMARRGKVDTWQATKVDEHGVPEFERIGWRSE